MHISIADLSFNKLRNGEDTVSVFELLVISASVNYPNVLNCRYAMRIRRNEERHSNVAVYMQQIR